jgi:hypothetical protein
MTERSPAASATIGVQLFDAAIAIAAASACALLLFGPFRLVVGDTPVSVRSTHLLFAAVALLLVRRAALPSTPISRSLRTWSAAVTDRPALSDALVAFALTRPAVLIIGFFAVVTVGLVPGMGPSSSRTVLRDLPARFDANWYASIAAEGYEWQHRYDRQQNFAFFPALPLTMRAAGVLTGAYAADIPRDRRIARFAWAGLIVALLAFIGACAYLSLIARETVAAARARAAVILVASYPFALFYSAAYTEALFLVAALGAWFHFRRMEYGRASLWGLLAGLARPNGCLLSVPFGLLAVGFADAPGSNPPPRTARSMLQRLAVAAMPGFGMLAYTIYLYSRTGEWFGWARVQAAWGRVFKAEAPALGELGSGLVQFAADHPYAALNATGLAFALALCWSVWRRLGFAWLVYVLLNIVPPLLAGGLLSMGRLSSTLFPLFLGLAAVLPSRTWPAVAAGFGVLQGFLAALFYTWRDVY